MLEGLRSGDPAHVGPFRLLGVLGTGGFGRVYLGQSDDGRQAAVKVIKPELAADPEFRARFRREVAAAAQVSGKFTARVLDADADGQEPWLATAYIPGPTLREAVAAQGPFPSESVLALAAGLAEALAAIHAAGLVHRDLKPDNVLLAYDGPRVIDFGIVRSAGTSTLTSFGTLMGTLAFMSPEQAIGGTVGPASDVFSLGSLLVFAATGQGPFGNGTVPEMLYRVAHEAPDCDHVPPPTRPLIQRCLAADPGQRPTASELVTYLRAATPTAGWLARTTALEVTPQPAGERAPGTAVVPGTDDTLPRTQARAHQPGPSSPADLARGGPGPDPRPSSGPSRRRRAGPGRRSVIAAAATALVAVGLGAAYFVTSLRHDPASSNAASSNAASSGAARWSGGHQVATAAGLVSISCSSAAFCAAADSAGSVYVYSGGSWSAPRLLSSGGLSWVSCPADGSCVATSNGGTLYDYSVGAWSSPGPLVGDDGKSAHLTSISCPTPAFCRATGGRDAYTFSGSGWTQGLLLQHGSSKFTSVSCSSAAFCAAVDSGGNVYLYSGGSWSAPHPLSSGGGLSWVSCPAAGFCVATSNGGDTVYEYSGGAWSSPPPLVGADGNPAHLTSVSCPTASFCLATGGLNAYTYAGHGWTRGQMVHNSHAFAAVSCASATFCAAVDSGGDVYTYGPPHRQQP